MIVACLCTHALAQPTPKELPKELPFDSLIKLRIHQEVQDIRKNQADLLSYILESHVRKVQNDYFIALQKKGMSAQEIQNVFKTKPYQNLFDRIRSNAALNTRAQNFLTQLTQPYYLEERVVEKLIDLADTSKGITNEVYQQAALDMQKNIREIKTLKPIEHETLLAKIKYHLRTFFGMAG